MPLASMFSVVTRFLDALRLRSRRRRYRPGVTLVQFVAPDICREVEVMDASDIHLGYITARVRTWNVLYCHRGLTQEPGFSTPQRIQISTLWEWHGADWGGPVPEDDER